MADEDRDFLQNNWDKIISSTPDLITKAQIQKKLSRQQQSSKFCEAHSSTSHFPSTPVPEMDLIPISPEDSGDDFTPKRPRTTKGTTVMIPKDILSKLGPTADRLNLSGTQLAGIVAAVTNHRHPLSRRTATVTWGRLTLMGSFCQDSEGLEKSTDWLSFSIRQVF